MVLRCLLPQRIVNIKIEETYLKLKAVLVEKGCLVVSETPQQLLVKQGSLWGISPKAAKKTINITLYPIEDKTSITYSSELTSDWKNITLIGCILALALVVVCVWMAIDLGAFLVDGNPRFWSWLVTASDHVEFQAGEAFINLTWSLAVFLSVVVISEFAILAYVRSKIDVLAEEALSQLS